MKRQFREGPIVYEHKNTDIDMKENDNKSKRRDFLKFGLTAGGALAVGTILMDGILSMDDNPEKGEEAILFDREGNVFQADPAYL
ncbi:MAG: twin-arginine translocation signal domain-containing protein, partial [Fidelibacterota bacterium]